MPWRGQRDIATWSSGLIINEASCKGGEDELDSCLFTLAFLKKHARALQSYNPRAMSTPLSSGSQRPNVAEKSFKAARWKEAKVQRNSH